MPIKSIKELLRKTADEVLKIIYPDKCIVCGKIVLERNDIGICRECIKNFHIFDDKTCRINFEMKNGYSMLTYNDSIKKIIHKFKYRDCGHYARAMGIMMGGFLLEKNLFSFDYIVPVPIHWKRERKRGFNQTEIMSAEISKIVRKPVLSNSLIRTRDTKPQFGLNKDMRNKNVTGAFKAAKPEKFSGKDILIIDDIYTTGSTIRECSKIIKECGAGNIYYFTLASADYTMSE